ncbi:YitT family protein [Bacillus marinisedimentorum]|uniref:YitT family protein n=1 Tax=Bacillus marinisedimentorum TaxID=1821260 RepID=UPI0007E27E3C|nr:YitT family protein [Bacillus marinisedimentorum]
MLKNLQSLTLLHLGAFLVAVNVHFILSPNTLATGGVSGLAILLNDLVPGLTIGAFMMITNIVLFIIGFIFIGFGFGAKTIYTSFMLSFMVWFLEYAAPLSAPLSEDILVQLILGQCIGAIGIALVLHGGASTGGTDIIAMILNKYFSIEMGRGLLLSDFAIAGSSFFIFGPEIGMYAIFGVVLNGLVIDYTLTHFNENKEVVIISSHSEEIRQFIVSELGQGATIHYARGAFTADEKEVITTILNRKNFSRLKKYITAVDQQAFITVHAMHEILGQNFKRLA